MTTESQATPREIWNVTHPERVQAEALERIADALEKIAEMLWIPPEERA